MESKSVTGKRSSSQDGSDRKYGKRCGAFDYRELDKLFETSDVDWFKLNQVIAYKGLIGRQRQEFCARYYQDKLNGLVNIQRAQMAYVSERRLSITCDEGCASCCSLYVEATVQECELIVYYLYQHEAVLARFMERYSEWMRGLKTSGNVHKEVIRLRQYAFNTESCSSMDDLNVKMNNLLSTYTAQNMQCPFLNDNSCSIYEVRPYTCAGLISAYPRKCCDENLAGSKFLRTIDDKVLSDLSFYYHPLGNQVVSLMALTIFEILINGLHNIARICGFAGVAEKHFSDPEVKLAIWQNRESIFHTKQAD